MGADHAGATVCFWSGDIRVRNYLAKARSHTDVRARQLALAARVLSFNLLGFSILVFGVSITHLGCASMKGHSVGCMSNLRVLGAGALMYSQDYDDHLPKANDWSMVIASHVAASATSDDFPSAGEDPFHCPAVDSVGGYGMNAALGGRSRVDGIDIPSMTVLFLDAAASTSSSMSSSSGNSSANLDRGRHQNAPNVAFADGHVKSVNSYSIDKLVWMPTAN